ncbi:MAG TPA: CrcB family protein [Bifidobacterium pullorum]|nr:CrcB family protein [Bifidobacterium pullorum]
MSEERQPGAVAGGDVATVTAPASGPVPPRIPLAPIKAVHPRFNPLADVMIYVVVFVGGCIGTGMRYGLGQLIPAAEPGAIASSFHLATFLANMAACFIYAALTTYVAQASWIRKRVRQLTSRGVGMGMCGGFSTLSAMVIEELTSLQQGHVAGFLIYVLASFVGGLAVAWMGSRLALTASAKREAKVVAEAFASMQSGGRHAAPTALVTAVENMPIAVDAPVVVPVPDAVAAAESSAVSAAAQSEGAAGYPFAGTQSPASSSLIDPKPDTAEIPVTPDPFTGEVRG